MMHRPLPGYSFPAHDGPLSPKEICAVPGVPKKSVQSLEPQEIRTEKLRMVRIFSSSTRLPAATRWWQESRSGMGSQAILPGGRQSWLP